MLLSLHVKNLALIEEAEVEFSQGLNILTGETGAGKSILLGSVNLALGAKADKDLIRRGADYALAELAFAGEDEKIQKKLAEMELPCEEGTVTISRRLQANRSISRINGETVSAKQVKELAEFLLDVHGQHEHQSLLHKKKHLEILDAYAGKEILAPLAKVRELFYEKNRIAEKMTEMEMDEAARKREMEFLLFAFDEIEQAALIAGEDEELESRYRRMVNSRKIGEALGACYRFAGGEEGASFLVGRAVRELSQAAVYDDGLSGLSEQIAEIEVLLTDFNRELSDYIADMEFDAADFAAVEERLNRVNHLKEKYGKTIDEVLAYKEALSEKIEMLNDYENQMAFLKRKYDETKKALTESCEAVSGLRLKQAKKLEKTLKQALLELNFLSVEFGIKIEKKEIAADGFDDVEFLISTNPGEERKPLGQVASGGELSRIMLGIKAVLADKDAVDTLIFDEIDAGISGRTAWKVSEKLGELSCAHQVICITHLPQIAAMADAHFAIEKQTDGRQTTTSLRRLSKEGEIEELARLLGADVLSDAALSNAREMKNEAAKIKQS